MSNIKAITVYSHGDSRLLSTWSNVPYLFCKALERKGIHVYRVNIESNALIRRIYDTISYRLFFGLFNSNACPIFERSPFHRWIVNRRLRKANEHYSDSELNLFLSYAAINKYSDKPNVLWCDWTDRVCIERMGREPKSYEQSSLNHEDTTIKKADLVYTMFPKCKEYMEQLYGREFRYLNRNVVNTVYNSKVDIDSNIKRRYESHSILFIGNHRYMSAAKELIEAFRIIKSVFSDLELHIIGMSYAELNVEQSAKGVFCYGYLRKDNDKECDKYYELLLNAKVFVNPATQWGGYSSTIEAMYYGCPVIISPYEDFVEEFGMEIDFGLYHRQGMLASELREILNLPYEQYRHLAKKAANRVEDYTWDNYIECLLKDLEDLTR